MEPIEKFECAGRTIEIEYDSNASEMNPRQDTDNSTTMICFHKRYNLGDEGHGYKWQDYNGWDELEAQIVKDHKPVIIMPLYLYDHSGITISTHSFNDHWDSGQVGFIYMTAKQIREWYGKKRITKGIKEKAEKCLLADVEVYDQYLRGEVYGYVITDENGEEDEADNGQSSSWGYFGLDSVKEEVKDIIERWQKTPPKQNTVPPVDVAGQTVMAI